MRNTNKLMLGLVAFSVAGTVQAAPLCKGKEVTVWGTPASETILGTMSPDVIHGLGGNDRIVGMEGNDTICGGRGNDFIIAGPGNDWANGQSGNDRIYGSPGDDRLLGWLGQDVIKGGIGHDLIYGGPGDDRLSGELGSDVMYAGYNGVDQMAGADYAIIDGKFVYLDGPKDYQEGDIDWCHIGDNLYDLTAGAGCFKQFNERPQHPAYPDISFPGPGTIIEPEPVEAPQE